MPVARRFKVRGAWQLFHGVITGYLPPHGTDPALYRVTYSDGDTEDLNGDEVTALMEAAEEANGPPVYWGANQAVPTLDPPVRTHTGNPPHAPPQPRDLIICTT